MSVLPAIAMRYLDRFKAFEPLGVAVFAIVAGGLLFFMMLTGEILEGESFAFDDAILEALRQPGDLSLPIGPAWLTHAVNDITSLGGITVLSLVTVLTVIYLLMARQSAVALFLFAAVVGGWLLSMMLKIGVARPRPEVVPHLVQVHDLSFPSGHAMVSAATYLTLGVLLARIQPDRRMRYFLIGVAVFLTLIVGLSRIYLGVHYPTDVLGGWCAGATWALTCWLVARSYLPAVARVS